MFPTSLSGGNGTDFISMTPGFATNTTNSTTAVTVVSITGSGILTCVSQSNSVTTSASGRLQITIDGVLVFLDNTFTSGSTSTPIQRDMSTFYPFKTSLLVEHFVSVSATMTTKVSYLVQ